MTDETAMRAVQNGDTDKAAILYERYKKPLFNFFLYRNVSYDTSQDLTQQVFLRLLKYRTSYREGAVFRTWIYEIARNIFHDHLKKLRISEPLSDFHDSPDTHYNDTPEQDIRRALQTLPENYREVLIMSHFQDMSYEEIGQLTGLTVANIKVRVHRAIIKLREAYITISQE